MTTFTSEDRENAKLVEEAPYHPGYEDAVVYPTVIVDSGASVHDREDSMQMLRDQIHAQQCEINALRKALMYSHPVKQETITPGQFICPSCGCKSLFKTDKSEWCMEYKCLWQSDYPVKQLSDEDIEACITKWAKDLYGTAYVEPTDHQRTMAIKMAKAIIKEITE